MTRSNDKPWDKDLRFVVKAGAVALALTGALLLFFQKAVPETPLEKRVNAISTRSFALPPEEVVALATQKSRSLVVIYASWCGHCRRLIPALIELDDDDTLLGTSPIMLSLDRKPRDWLRYLAQFDRFPFIPYRLTYGDNDKLVKQLNEAGSRYNSTIPHLSLFEDGKLIAEMRSFTHKDALKQFIQTEAP